MKSRRPSVVALVDKIKEQSTRQTMLLEQFYSLRFLMDQGLAALGHCNVQVNIMRFRTEDILKFQQWLESGEYIPIT